MTEPVDDLRLIGADPVSVTPDYDSLCDVVSEHIAALIRAKPGTVLGLATGSTPLGVYQRLIRLHEQGRLDFSQVTCFNLDEYYPMEPESEHSYHYFMRENLFSRINCPRWFVPEGRPGSPKEIARACQDYETRIQEAGGIDLQLLGIGRSGHIGFNEPGSAPDSRTRLVSLHPLTREDAAPSFAGLEQVPSQAVSMGIGTILEARAIVMMASGSAKADIVRQTWTGDISDAIPASWVRTHPQVCLYLDSAAALLLRADAPALRG